MLIAVVDGGIGYPLASLPYPQLEQSLKVMQIPERLLKWLDL